MNKKLINGSEKIDFSGYEIRDNSDDHRWKFPEGTTINPGEFKVADAKSEGLVFDDSDNSYKKGSFVLTKETKVYDAEAMFLEDSSGLDFYNGRLYGVDNGTAKFWVMDVAKDGQLKLVKGFENGKRVMYRKDAGNSEAKGPDTDFA